MGLLGERELKRQQWDEGDWSGGTYTKGPARITLIRGTWRPMPGEVAQLLGIGDRQKDGRVVFTQINLHTLDQHDNQPPDHISPDDGATYYEVISEYEGDEVPGFSAGVRHRKYALLRVQEVDG